MTPNPQDSAVALEVERVYLVATGETYDGQETYTRHDARPPLCDAETLYTAPLAAQQPNAEPAAGDQAGAVALRKGYVAVPMRLTRAMQDVLEQESWEWADLLMMAEATTEEEDEAIRRFESLDLLEKAEREAAERQEWPTMHPATADLVQRFSQALAEKLAAAEKKYGYSDGWLQSHWMDECRAKLLEHVAKGDPRDVAAYCAFLWHHGESTALASREEAPATPQGEPVAFLHIDQKSFLAPWPDYRFTPGIVIKSMPVGTYKLYAALTQPTTVQQVLRIHHEWSIRHIPGYSEHGDERVAYRATIAALNGNGSD